MNIFVCFIYILAFVCIFIMRKIKPNYKLYEIYVYIILVLYTLYTFLYFG